MFQEKCTDSQLTPLETLFSNMTFLEQFAEGVSEYSSKYSSRMSVLYAPENVIGRPTNYPNYGDFPDTYMLRSYGKWWKESEADQPSYMTQDIDHIISEDYIIVSFENAVIPTSIRVYEIYNAGGIVRLWGNTGKKWILLWESPPSSGMQTSNIFKPPIKQIQELISEVRIDFNQSLLPYHTSIDAILIAGYRPKSILQTNLLNSGIIEKYITPVANKDEVDSLENDVCNDNFSKLPYEALLHIFQYLDLISLCRSAQVNKRFYSVSCDSTLYRELSLKRYWHKVDSTTLKYFMNRSKQIRKLDISWCDKLKSIPDKLLVQFLQECCSKLTHLSAGVCGLTKVAFINQISNCSDLTDLRLRNYAGPQSHFASLSYLTKLNALDLYGTSIDDDTLSKILKSNKDLKHLILDFCESLHHVDEIAAVARNYNKKLVTWSSWKTNSLTSVGIEHLSYCSNLRELDVGWCLMLRVPADSLNRISIGCKDMRRLILSGWRGLTDHSLLPVIRACKQLTQLDLLGIKNISEPFCEIVLASLPKLQLLDISYCNSIDAKQVRIWRKQYPDVTIQHSYDSNIIL